MRSSQSNHPLTATMTDPQQSTSDSHANTLMSFKTPDSKRIVVCRRLDDERLSSRYGAFENKQV